MARYKEQAAAEEADKRALRAEVAALRESVRQLRAEVGQGGTDSLDAASGLHGLPQPSVSDRTSAPKVETQRPEVHILPGQAGARVGVEAEVCIETCSGTRHRVPDGTMLLSSFVSYRDTLLCSLQGLRDL